jgi:hypothetical protein
MHATIKLPASIHISWSKHMQHHGARSENDKASTRIRRGSELPHQWSFNIATLPGEHIVWSAQEGWNLERNRANFERVRCEQGARYREAGRETKEIETLEWPYAGTAHLWARSLRTLIRRSGFTATEYNVGYVYKTKGAKYPVLAIREYHASPKGTYTGATTSSRRQMSWANEWNKHEGWTVVART